MLSPNFGDRRGGLTPDLVVIHYTAMQSCAAALSRLCDPAAEVSAHYLIDVDGTVLSLVAEDMRAWHAGAGTWGDCDDVNSRSVGIELANDGAQPFSAPQMAALEAVLQRIMARWSIGPAGVIGHSDMAPDRKSDPGLRFDWRRLALAGLSVWPDTTAMAEPEAFLPAAVRFGYGAGLSSDHILRAFRLRFRPWATGPLDAVDAGSMVSLARRFANF